MAKEKSLELDLSPQQQLFLKNYLNPKSSTWGNAMQSAINAGYTEEYAKVMISRDLDWLSENVKKNNLVTKAEKNLEIALDGGLDDVEKGAKVIQWKATELTLKTQGKEQGYTERTELTGKDGKDLVQDVLTKEEKDKLLELLK